MPLDWDLLHAFLAVARSGQLNSAARQMHVNYSTLSRKLARLERELSTKLFERSTAGLSLTPHGEALLKHTEEIESEVFTIQSTIANASARVSGVVRIGTPDAFGTMFLAPKLGRLAELYPNLEIQLVAIPAHFSLSKREADIAIGLSRPERGRLYARQLTDYEFGIYANEEHSDISQIKTPSDLAKHIFVSYIDDLIFAPELEFIPAISKNIIPRLKSSSLLAQLQVVAGGGGFGILPCFLADGDPRLVRVLTQEIALIRTFWMIVHSEMRDLARVRVISNFIAAEVQAASRIFLPSRKTALTENASMS